MLLLDELLGDLSLSESLLASLTSTGLDTHLHLRRHTEVDGRIVEHWANVGHDLIKESLLLRLDISDGQSSGSLLVHDVTETGLTLDNAVRNIHAAAQSWEPDDELDWVDIVGDDHKLGLAGLNKVGNMVDTELDETWLLSSLDVTLGLAISLLLQTKTLLGVRLWAQMSKETEHIAGLVLLKSTVELLDLARDLEAIVQNGALTLDTDVLWPLDETGKVAARLDITTDTKVAGALWEKVRVLVLEVLLGLSAGLLALGRGTLGRLRFRMKRNKRREGNKRGMVRTLWGGGGKCKIKDNEKWPRY
jgi:hypothetical protein